MLQATNASWCVVTVPRRITPQSVAQGDIRTLPTAARLRKAVGHPAEHRTAAGEGTTVTLGAAGQDWERGREWERGRHWQHGVEKVSVHDGLVPLREGARQQPLPHPRKEARHQVCQHPAAGARRNGARPIYTKYTPCKISRNSAKRLRLGGSNVATGVSCSCVIRIVTRSGYAAL